ncbi:MAG: hypothetical protein ABTA24_12865 [Arthrobacter sp.]
MATEYGTVADWVAAIGTVGAILVAAYTFWKSATGTRRVEAQRVVTTWHTKENPDADVEEGEYRFFLVGMIYNFGSTPVSDVSLLLDIPDEDRRWSMGDLRVELPMIPPGQAKSVEFPIKEISLGLLHRLHTQGLNKDTIVEFWDASGYNWRTHHAETKRIYGGGAQQRPREVHRANVLTTGRGK